MHQIFAHITALRSQLWLSQALAVSLTICVSQICKAVHPPAGATALIAALNPSAFLQGWWYPLLPILWDVTILTLGAYLLNNLSGRMVYPKERLIPFGKKKQ